MKKIEEIRQWIQVCEKGGIQIPEQIYLLDAYATLLEARLMEFQAKTDAGEK